MLGNISPWLFCGSERLAPEAATVFVLGSFSRMFVCDQPCETELGIFLLSNAWACSASRVKKIMSSFWWRTHLPIIHPLRSLSQSSPGLPTIAKWKSVLSCLWELGFGGCLSYWWQLKLKEINHLHPHEHTWSVQAEMLAHRQGKAQTPHIS